MVDFLGESGAMRSMFVASARRLNPNLSDEQAEQIGRMFDRLHGRWRRAGGDVKHAIAARGTAGNHSKAEAERRSISEAMHALAALAVPDPRKSWMLLVGLGLTGLAVAAAGPGDINPGDINVPAPAAPKTAPSKPSGPADRTRSGPKAPGAPITTTASDHKAPLPSAPPLPGPSQPPPTPRQTRRVDAQVCRCSRHQHVGRPPPNAPGPTACGEPRADMRRAKIDDGKTQPANVVAQAPRTDERDGRDSALRVLTDRFGVSEERVRDIAPATRTALVAALSGDSPTCCITLDELLDGNGRVTPNVSALVQQADSRVQAFLYRGRALEQWLAAAGPAATNPLNRQPVDRRRDIVSLS